MIDSISRYIKSLTLDDLVRMWAIVIAYYVSGKLGLIFALTNPSTTAIWAPSGIALAAFILYGRRILPAIFIAAFLTNLTTAGTIITSLGIALGNTMEGLVASYFIIRFAKGVKAFEEAKTVVVYTTTVVLATMIAATIGASTLLISDFMTLAELRSVWGTWWLGDLAGTMIIAPLIILWITSKPSSWKKSQIIETLILLLTLTVISEYVFLGTLHITYLCLPILIWAAIRLSPREAVTAVFFVAFIATVATLFEKGPFYADRQNLNRALQLLQFFLGTISVMTMTVAAVVIERKRNQEKLESSEKRFKALIEKSADAISLLDANGVTLYDGPSTEKILGYKPEELVGINAFDLMHPDDLKHTLEVFAKIVKIPNSTEGAEFRLKKKDGSWSWMEGTGTNLLADEAVGAIVINYRDISERKKIEETIEREKAEDEALLESIGDGILATGKDGNIVLVNKAFEDLVGWEETEVLGKKTSEFLVLLDEKAEYIPKEKRPFDKAVSEKKKITETHYIVKKNKEKFPATIVVTPVILNGEIIGTIKVIRDITREKEIDKAKTEFVSLASHQLKTPLSTINWYIELLVGKYGNNLDEKGKDYLLEVYRASKRMGALINALLTVSRIELNKINLIPQNVNLVACITEVLNDFKPQIQEKNFKIKEDYLTKKEDYSIHSDPKLVQIVFQNILSNAIKYTKEGGTISISFSRNDDTFIIKISDNGYGIPKAEQDKIFSKLYRASNIKTIDQDGTGLGLYIVKSILEKIQGSIRFESEQNKGTAFYIKLPKEARVVEKVLQN